MMKEEGGGALGTTIDSGSESIQSTASALRWVNGGGCKWVPQDLRAPLIPFVAGTQALPLRVCSRLREGRCSAASLP